MESFFLGFGDFHLKVELPDQPGTVTRLGDYPLFKFCVQVLPPAHKQLPPNQTAIKVNIQVYLL